MGQGNNILLITNNNSIVGRISPELVQLRNVRNIIIESYEKAASTISVERPELVLIYCENSTEEMFCTDLIKEIKSIFSIPIILIYEKYDIDFIKKLYKCGISDYLSLENSEKEILMKTIWCLQKKESKETNEKYKHILEELNILNKDNGFYTTKYSEKVLNKALQDCKSKKNDAIFLGIYPNKSSRLKPSTENIIQSIKTNIRSTDLAFETRQQNLFYILLTNTNTSGAMVVWNRINEAIGANETLYGCLCDVENKNFEKLEEKIKSGLEESAKGSNLLYIIDESEKDVENWIDEISIEKKESKNFKLFATIYKKKLEKIIKPTLNEILSDYSELLQDTKIEEELKDYDIIVNLTNISQKSCLKIEYKGVSTIEIDTVHEGLDSPENNHYSIDLNEITKREIENIVEDFLLEFKSCI